MCVEHSMVRPKDRFPSPVFDGRGSHKRGLRSTLAYSAWAAAEMGKKGHLSPSGNVVPYDLCLMLDYMRVINFLLFLLHIIIKPRRT